MKPSKKGVLEEVLAEDYIPLIRTHTVSDVVGMKDRPTVKTAKKAAELFAAYLKKVGADQEGKEYLLVMLLNSRHRLIGIETVSIGKLDGSLAHPREVFLSAILHKAASLYVGHNHPSGDIDPSPEDESTTTLFKTAGGLLDIPVNGHIIIGGGAWKSI